MDFKSKRYQEEEDPCDGLVVQLQREMSAAQRDTERFYARLMELKREHAAHVRSVAREYNSERYADSEPDTEPRSILKTRQPGRTTQVQISHKIYVLRLKLKYAALLSENSPMISIWRIFLYYQTV